MPNESAKQTNTVTAAFALRPEACALVRRFIDNATHSQDSHKGDDEDQPAFSRLVTRQDWQRSLTINTDTTELLTPYRHLLTMASRSNNPAFKHTCFNALPIVFPQLSLLVQLKTSNAIHYDELGLTEDCAQAKFIRKAYLNAIGEPYKCLDSLLKLKRTTLYYCLTKPAFATTRRFGHRVHLISIALRYRNYDLATQLYNLLTKLRANNTHLDDTKRSAISNRYQKALYDEISKWCRGHENPHTGNQVRWYFETFNVPEVLKDPYGNSIPRKVLFPIYDLFINAAAYGKIETLKWQYQFFPEVKLAFLGAPNYKAVNLAARNGHEAVVLRLVELIAQHDFAQRYQFNQHTISLREMAKQATPLVEALQNNHFELADKLIATFKRYPRLYRQKSKSALRDGHLLQARKLKKISDEYQTLYSERIEAAQKRSYSNPFAMFALTKLTSPPHCRNILSKYDIVGVNTELAC